MWDRMLGFLGFEEDEEEEVELAPAAAVPASPVRAESTRRRPVRPTHAAWGEERAEAGRTSPGRAGNVTRLLPASLGLVVCSPKRFEESQEAADHLKAGKPVILHLDGMERDLVQKFINFLMGSVYALGGEMHRVGSVVLFVPAGIEVTLPLSLRMAERDGR